MLAGDRAQQDGRLNLENVISGRARNASIGEAFLECRPGRGPPGHSRREGADIEAQPKTDRPGKSTTIDLTRLWFAFREFDLNKAIT